MVGYITTIAGSGDEDPRGYSGPALSAGLGLVSAVAVDASYVYLSEISSDTIRRVGTSGQIETIAGIGVSGFGGDGEPAILAALNGPSSIALGPDGSLWVADSWNHRIRRIDTQGVIRTVAGTGVRRRDGQGSMLGCFWGDGGPAAEAALDRPDSLCLDGTGNVYFLDHGNHRIRRISPDGRIDTVLDTDPSAEGDGAATDLAIDLNGSLYYPDAQWRQVFRLDPDGHREVVAGHGDLRYLCGQCRPDDDGQPAGEVGFMAPRAIAVDSAGSIFISDDWDELVRKIGTAGRIKTVAGCGGGDFSGDGGPAVAARLNGPNGIAIDGSGNLLIADEFNCRVRRVERVAAPGLIAGRPLRSS